MKSNALMQTKLKTLSDAVELTIEPQLKKLMKQMDKLSHDYNEYAELNDKDMQVLTLHVKNLNKIREQAEGGVGKRLKTKSKMMDELSNAQYSAYQQQKRNQKLADVEKSGSMSLSPASRSMISASLTNSPLSQTQNGKRIANLLKDEHQGLVEIALKKINSPLPGDKSPDTFKRQNSTDRYRHQSDVSKASEVAYKQAGTGQKEQIKSFMAPVIGTKAFVEAYSQENFQRVKQSSQMRQMDQGRNNHPDGYQKKGTRNSSAYDDSQPSLGNKLTAMNWHENDGKGSTQAPNTGALSLHEGPTEVGHLSISRKQSSTMVPPIQLQKIKQVKQTNVQMLAQQKQLNTKSGISHFTNKTPSTQGQHRWMGHDQITVETAFSQPDIHRMDLSKPQTAGNAAFRAQVINQQRANTAQGYAGGRRIAKGVPQVGTNRGVTTPGPGPMGELVTGTQRTISRQATVSIENTSNRSNNNAMKIQTYGTVEQKPDRHASQVMTRTTLQPLSHMNPRDITVNSSGQFIGNADLSDDANFRAEAILAPLAKLSSNAGEHGQQESRRSVFLESQMQTLPVQSSQQQQALQTEFETIHINAGNKQDLRDQRKLYKNQIPIAYDKSTQRNQQRTSQMSGTSQGIFDERFASNGSFQPRAVSQTNHRNKMSKTPTVYSSVQSKNFNN